MFQGKLVNRFSGTSKKSGNTFYSVDVFVDMPSGSRTLLKSFINANLYDKISSIPLDSDVICKCGVNNFGNIVVCDISVAK